jgi:hypothetical protein
MSFDHEAAAAIVQTPSDTAGDEFLTQMKRYVIATPTNPTDFFEAAIRRYGESLGLSPVVGSLTATEEKHLAGYDKRFVDSEWLEGAARPAQNIWRAKVKSGVWVGSAAMNGHRVTATFHGQEVAGVRVEGTETAFLGMDQLLNEMAASPPI